MHALMCLIAIQLEIHWGILIFPDEDKGPVIIYAEGGGEKERGSRLFQIGQEGAKLFIKKLEGGQQFEVHFKSGPLPKVGKAECKQYIWNSHSKLYSFVLILLFSFV